MPGNRSRDPWRDWAKDVAETAERHITRISSLVQQPESDAKSFFQKFLLKLRDDLNESITEPDAIEMLAQHLITRPVFNALFEDHAFFDRNPITLAMTEVLSVIDKARIEREIGTLEDFHASVRRRAKKSTDPLARQRLIVELYEKFFRGAFPRTTKMHGIVYTPVELVDFIIQSANEALQDEFGQTLGSKGVHILDPFAGTGIFITRLMQSGLIAPENMERKYLEEIHANEIVLLAHYIATINIESAFHSITTRDDYLPYTGICLTDTFSLHEDDDELPLCMKDDADRRERQKKTDIRVIVGNPPYSVGQRSANDNAKNVEYERLDRRIRDTYAQQSNATLMRNLYDSYIRAIRWGSDRLGKSGVMAYVTGSAWVERTFANGIRKCLAEEFASIHVLHLRGDIRKNMMSGNSAGEGENVFGQSSMTGVSMTVFVKNPDASEQGRILFHDIGDDLKRKQKLDGVRRFGSIGGVGRARKWNQIIPDKYGDWLNQRDQSWNAYPKIGDKKDKKGTMLFEDFSLGVITNRDPWCINSSRTELTENIRSTIDFYNSEQTRWQTTKNATETAGQPPPSIDDFIVEAPTRIEWSRKLIRKLEKGQRLALEDGQFVRCMHRPFTKRWQYYSRDLNEDISRMPHIFPNDEQPNRVIAITGKGGRSGFSALMMDALPNLDTIEKGQCFPLWLYEADREGQTDLLEAEIPGYKRLDAITDDGLLYFRKAYPSENVSREDIFHYVYGLLHSEDYRHRFRANLDKELPRIPCVKPIEDFRALRDAGKHLGKLHVDYEDIDPYPATIDTGGKLLMEDPKATFRITKMKHPRSGKSKDQSTVIYNPHITIRDVPEEAWEYVVNGKPALTWIMEHQCVKPDKKSGIVNDANRYAAETIGNSRYPLDLFLRMITVSLKTMKIVRALPKLVIQ